MCWSWIDSSRKREALTISCPGPGIASLRRCKAGPGQKIAKTTPCKVEWTPARSTLAALRPGQKKGPNLISSRSSRPRHDGNSSQQHGERPTHRKRTGEHDREFDEHRGRTPGKPDRKRCIEFGFTLRSESRPVATRAACRRHRGLVRRHPPDGWSIQPRVRHERACQD